MVSIEDFASFQQLVHSQVAELQQAVSTITSKSEETYNTVRQNVAEIEIRINNLQYQQMPAKPQEKKGLEKMFDGKNAKLVPSMFEKEGKVSFKKWAA